MAHACKVCHSNTNLKRCTRCRQTFYCGREHQMQDWSKHKLECQSISPNDKNSCTVRVNSVQSNQHSNTSDDSRENGAIPFDERPLRPEVFNAPNFHDAESLGKLVSQTLNKQNYCVVDGVFTKSHLKSMLKEIDSFEIGDTFVSGQLSGGRTSGKEEMKVTEHSIRSDKIVWIEGNETYIPNITKVVKKMDSIMTVFSSLQPKICINGRTKAMLSCYPGNGTFYKRHVDNPNKDGRIVTCILYLNMDWDVQKHGGLLRIFEGTTDIYHDVPPLFNRMLFFWSDQRNPHEVQPAYKSRYAITVWYFDKEERQRAKDEERVQEMFQLTAEEIQKDINRMEKEKRVITDKIEDEAVKAVKSLSKQELAAIADLVKDHPDPSAALSTLGISPKIQDVLLQHLNLNS